MKMLKKILIGIGVLIALPFLVALFIPRQYTVSVTETIDKPASEVYDYVRILKNQQQWSEWVKADPNLKPEIKGTDGSIGAIQHWDSKDDNVGEGEQEITALSPERMDLDLRFKRPFEGKSKAAYIFKATSPTQTQLTADFYADENYPLNLPSYLFGKPMIEKTQKKNLANIKAILEGK